MTKVLSGHYPNGYAAPTNLLGVSVTATGVIKGTGLTAAAGLTVINGGEIAGGAGAGGAYAYPDAGSGGAGNNGVTLNEVSRLTNVGAILGGAGGAGGNGNVDGPAGFGGYGGNGGVGVDMQQGGILVNQSKVTGGAGGDGGDGYSVGGAAGAGAAAVLLGASATVTNSGQMQGGAGAFGGFSQYGPNASTSGGDGLQGSAGTFLLRNSGTIGGGAATAAGTSGGAGVDLAAGSVINTGALRGGNGSATTADYGGEGGVGVVLRANGQVSNGVGGTITGGFGGAGSFAYFNGYFYVAAQAGNTGGVGVDLAGGGGLTNSGLIGGGAGGSGGVTVNPFASYSAGLGGQGGAGVSLGANGFVLNKGTIHGGAGGLGGAAEGANSTGGSGGAGGAGVFLGAAATVTNFGSISGGAGGAAGSVVAGDTPGSAGAAGDGVVISSGGQLINGDHTNTHARVSGAIGVDVTGSAAVTVTNFGTIQGSTAAVQFGSSADHLIAMSGADFVGGMKGGGGTLELDGGSVSISSIGGGGVLSGGDKGSFSGFATYEFDAGGHWTAASVNLAAGDLARDAGALAIDGDVTLAAGSQLDETKGGVIKVGSGVTVDNAGQIQAGGPGGIVIQDNVDNTGKLIANGGKLVITGNVAGAGSANIEDGVLHIDGTFSQNVAFLGADPSGTLALKKATAYGGTVSGFSTDGETQLDLLDVGFTSANEASFSGNASGGVLTVSDGTETAKIKLKGDYVGDTFTAKSDGHGGVIVTASDPGASAAAAQLVQAIASFGVGADPPAAFQAPIGPVQAEALIAPSMIRTLSNAGRG